MSDGGDEAEAADGAAAAPSPWPVVISSIAAAVVAAGTATFVLARKYGWAALGAKVRAMLPGRRPRS